MALIYFLMRFSWRIMMSPVSRVILWLSAFFLCLSNILLVGERELLNCDVWFLIHFLLWNQRNMKIVLQVIYFQIICLISFDKKFDLLIKFRQYILTQTFKLFSDLPINHSSKRREKNVNCRITRGKFVVYKCPFNKQSQDSS